MAKPRKFPKTDELEDGGHLRVEGEMVTYVATKKRYNLKDPEEQVRAIFYLELIKKYSYPPHRIDEEVLVPARKPEFYADLVVYEDDDKKKPYIVVECKKDGIPQAEIKQAVEQAFGNANSLRAKYAMVVAGTVTLAFDVAGFKPSEREKNVIADIPIRYGKVVQYKFKKGDSNWELREADRNELLAKFQQCHDIIWEGGKRNPAEAFDEMSKLMFCKIQDERFFTKKGDFYKFQVGTYETIREVAHRIRQIYRDAQEGEPGVFVEAIKIEDPILRNVVEVLQGISLSRTDLDAKGVAFEHFLGRVFRGEMGQYFTPRTIVEFVVQMLNPSERDKLIDPACGSGGFLLYALDKVRQDLEKKLDPKDAEDAWKDFGLHRLFGIEINSQLARVAMMNMIIHEDGHSNIENNDALDDPSKFNPRRDIGFGKYSLLMTNPPFGAIVKDNERAYLGGYELGGKVKRRSRQKTEILFIERCLDFLKPGAKMGIVLPDGILTNSSLQYVRDFITDRAQILAVVSLPQTTFTHYGAGVKASLLFLRKKKPREYLPDDYPIFMAIAEHIGYDATGRPDKNELPEIVNSYRRFLKGETSNFPEAPLCFVVERGEAEGRLDPNYHRSEFREATSKIKHTRWAVKTLGELSVFVSSGSTPKADGFIPPEVPFLRIINIQDGHIIINENTRYINRRIHDRMLKRTQLKSGDILISIAGSLGLSAVVPPELGDANINQDFARVVLKEEINPHYVASFLNTALGTSQIFQRSYGATHPHLNHPKVKSIIIPLPPRQIQDKVANMMDEAYRLKKEKEEEAEKLLNSIDDYVLKELGIKLPDLKEEKQFVVNFTQIRADRLDPYYHQPKFERLEEALLSSGCSITPFGEIITDMSGGATPKAKGEAYMDRPGIPFLRIQNITEEGIDLHDVKFINEETHNGLLRRSQLKPKDIIFTITGRIGTVAVVPEDFGEGNINQHSVRIHLRDDVDQHFVGVFLNSILGNQMSMRRVSGGTRVALDYPSVKALRIPLPPLSTQRKIAEEVQSRRDNAKRLTEEAKEAFENAKREVERMILGK